MNFETAMKNKPHVVILGAGASVAAIPNGDANGKKTSVMSGFIDKLGMRDIFENIKINTNSDNLEDIYSELYQRKECRDILTLLEDKIYNYFLEFKIPSKPTIYDFLTLSLRKKDVIATFNWDPLLLQAYQRVKNLTTELPDLLFLHGNVRVGICHEHKRSGIYDDSCPVCGKEYEKSKLLYPIKKKNYNNDSYIKDNWNALQYYLKDAFLVTLFGYSAPKSDVIAIDMLKKHGGQKKNEI